jgi:hypothetical protein
MIPLVDLMRLQGDIKVRFMQLGQAQETAHILASEALHIVATSDAVTQEHRDAYRGLGEAQSTPATT